jgi:hypothetical protein
LPIESIAMSAIVGGNSTLASRDALMGGLFTATIA